MDSHVAHAYPPTSSRWVRHAGRPRVPPSPWCRSVRNQGLTDDGHAFAHVLPDRPEVGGACRTFGCSRRLDAEIFVFWLTMPGGIGIPRVCMEYECYSISGIITP